MDRIDDLTLLDAEADAWLLYAVSFWPREEVESLLAWLSTDL